MVDYRRWNHSIESRSNPIEIASDCYGSILQTLPIRSPFIFALHKHRAYLLIKLRIPLEHGDSGAVVMAAVRLSMSVSSFGKGTNNRERFSVVAITHTVALCSGWCITKLNKNKILFIISLGFLGALFGNDVARSIGQMIVMLGIPAQTAQWKAPHVNAAQSLHKSYWFSLYFRIGYWIKNFKF